MSTENFVTNSVDGKVARVEAIDPEGKTIDQFELYARHPALVAPYLSKL